MSVILFCFYWIQYQLGTYSNCLNACFFDQMIEMKAKCCADKFKSRNFEKIEQMDQVRFAQLAS